MSIRFGLAAAFTTALLTGASSSNAQVITQRDVGVRMGLAIAAKIPAARMGGAIEVRPLVER